MFQEEKLFLSIPVPLQSYFRHLRGTRATYLDLFHKFAFKQGTVGECLVANVECDAELNAVAAMDAGPHYHHQPVIGSQPCPILAHQLVLLAPNVFVKRQTKEFLVLPVELQPMVRRKWRSVHV